VVDVDADGNEVLHSIPLVARGEAGFREDANVIGEDWARPADTALEGNRKEVERFAMDASSQDEVDAKRKQNATPFGGRIDPFKVIEQAPDRTWMPRKGTELVPATSTRAAAARVLTQFEAAKALATRGVPMSRELTALLRREFEAGVPEDQLDALQARFTVRAGLRVVAGGAQ